MKLNQLPQPILVRLMELDEQASLLAEQADHAEHNSTTRANCLTDKSRIVGSM